MEELTPFPKEIKLKKKQQNNTPSIHSVFTAC